MLCCHDIQSQTNARNNKEAKYGNAQYNENTVKHSKTNQAKSNQAKQAEPCRTNSNKQTDRQTNKQTNQQTNKQTNFNRFFLPNENLWSDVTHCCKHGDATVLEFCLSTSLKVLNTSIGCEPGGVPKPRRSLHTQLVLESAKGDLASSRRSVKRLLGVSVGVGITRHLEVDLVNTSCVHVAINNRLHAKQQGQTGFGAEG